MEELFEEDSVLALLGEFEHSSGAESHGPKKKLTS